MKSRWIILAVFILISCWSRSSESRSMADIFKEVDGSVTVVVVLHKVSSASAGIQQTMGLNVGSGVLVSKSGKVITAAHLVNTADQIKVKLSNGEVVGAQVTASAPLRMSHYCSSNQYRRGFESLSLATPRRWRW